MNVEMLRLEMHGSSGRAQPKLWRPLHRQAVLGLRLGTVGKRMRWVLDF